MTNNRAWLLIENETTGEREPDGQGGWADKVITRVLAGTLDECAVNVMLEALVKYQEAQKDPEKRAQTHIRTSVVVMPSAIQEVIDNSTTSGLLEEILGINSKD